MLPFCFFFGKVETDYGEQKTDKEKSHKGIWWWECPGSVPGINSGRPRHTRDVWADLCGNSHSRGRRDTNQGVSRQNSLCLLVFFSYPTDRQKSQKRPGQYPGTVPGYYRPRDCRSMEEISAEINFIKIATQIGKEEDDDHDQDSLKKTLWHIWSWSSENLFLERKRRCP